MITRWSPRLLGGFLALVCGLATVGPEIHTCPIHDQPTAGAAGASGHAGHAAGPLHETPDHPADGGPQHCTCPQICPAGSRIVALAAAPLRWTSVAARRPLPVPTLDRTVLPGAPRYLLPFAIAPPRALV